MTQATAQSTTTTAVEVQSVATASTNDLRVLSNLFATKKEGSECPLNGYAGDALLAVLEEPGEGREWRVFTDKQEDGRVRVRVSVVAKQGCPQAPYHAGVPVAVLHPTKSEVTVYAGDLNPAVAQAMRLPEGAAALGKWRTSKAGNQVLLLFVGTPQSDEDAPGLRKDLLTTQA
jgi:hypothetical protein